MRRFDFEEVTSTNDQALTLAGRHPGERLLVVARRQRAGRGRGGRLWHSPEGGAWFTLAAPAPAEPARYGPLPLLVGEAVLQAVEQAMGRIGQPGNPAQAAPLLGRLQLKWPNDLLLDGLKIAGVLCERTVCPQHLANGSSGTELPVEGRPRAECPGAEMEAANRAGAILLVGVGINANFSAAELPSDLRTPVITLREAFGRSVDLADLIAGAAQGIARALDHLEAAGFTADDARRLETRLAWRGQPVSLTCGSQRLCGLLRGLDAQGRLRLQVGTDEQRLSAGEIEHLRPDATFDGARGEANQLRG